MLYLKDDQTAAAGAASNQFMAAAWSVSVLLVSSQEPTPCNRPGTGAWASCSRRTQCVGRGLVARQGEGVGLRHDAHV